MKFAVRVAALALIIVAALAGNSSSKTTAVASMHQGTVPGPMPTCNPFTQNCGKLR
jgi:hypothetical protein